MYGERTGPAERSPDPAGRLPGFLEEIDVRLLFAAVEDLPAGAWDHDGLPNEYWRLYQNDAAGGTVIAGDSRTDLAAGGVYLIPSDLNLASRNRGGFTQLYVHFDLRGVPPFALRDLLPGPVLVDGGVEFTHLVGQVGGRVRTTGIDDVALQCQLKGVIYAAFGYHLGNVPGTLVADAWARLQAMQPVAPALQLVERQLDRTFTNRELAQACAMSENHFIRRFRDAVGVTPAAYIQKKRLASAAHLLLYTSESIDTIALKTGFADRFYFSRAFRRAMGHPPAAYRRLPRR